MIFFIIFLALILISFLIMMSKNSKQPDNIGVTNGKFAPLSNKPNSVSTQTDQSEKLVSPLPFQGSLLKSREIIIDIIKSFEKTEILEMTDDYIHVVFSTNTMKFKDDVEFYFNLERNEIHFRSASRVGYSDMGVNKERYNEIKQQYLKN